jgi:hypothetical protein
VTALHKSGGSDSSHNLFATPHEAKAVYKFRRGRAICVDRAFSVHGNTSDL